MVSPQDLLFVESHDHFDDIGAFDAATGRLERYSRSTSAGRLRAENEPVSGHYSDMGTTLGVLFRYGGALSLQLGDRRWRVDDSHSRVTWERSGSTARFSISNENGGFETIEYTPGPNSGPPLADDSTPFAEDEDWDFGLFVRNILADAGRRDRIYTRDVDASVVGHGRGFVQ